MTARPLIRGPLSDLSKGALLGLSNTIVIAIAFATSVGMGHAVVHDDSLIGNEICHNAHGNAGPAQVLWAVIVYGWMSGVGWGLIFGSMTRSVADFPPVLRVACYVMVAMLAMLICVAFWPDIAPHAWTSTAIHAALLASWTRKPDPEQIPLAVARSTAKQLAWRS